VFGEEDDEQQVDHMQWPQWCVCVCVVCLSVSRVWMHDPVCCPLVMESPFQVTVAIHVPPLLTGPARRCQSCLSVSQSVGQSLCPLARSLSLFFCVNTTVVQSGRIHIYIYTHTHTHTHTTTMPACSSAERSTHRVGKQRRHNYINITERRADEWPG
jgi:hypothetical protein